MYTHGNISKVYPNGLILYDGQVRPSCWALRALDLYLCSASSCILMPFATSSVSYNQAKCCCYQEISPDHFYSQAYFKEAQLNFRLESVAGMHAK